MENDAYHLERARKSVKWLLELGLPKFSPEAGRRLYLRTQLDTALSAHFDSAAAANLVARADSGDELADEAIRIAEYGYLSVDEPCPLILKDYLLKRHGAQNLRRRGPKPHGTFFRDDIICHAVKMAMAEGFDLSRNDGTRSKNCRHSASSIVSEALAELGETLDEDRIAEVVRSRTG